MTEGRSMFYIQNSVVCRLYKTPDLASSFVVLLVDKRMLIAVWTELRPLSVSRGIFILFFNIVLPVKFKILFMWWVILLQYW